MHTLLVKSCFDGPWTVKLGLDRYYESMIDVSFIRVCYPLSIKNVFVAFFVLCLYRWARMVKRLMKLAQLPAWMKGFFHLCQEDQLLHTLGMILKSVLLLNIGIQLMIKSVFGYRWVHVNGLSSQFLRKVMFTFCVEVSTKVCLHSCQRLSKHSLDHFTNAYIQMGIRRGLIPKGKRNHITDVLNFHVQDLKRPRYSIV